jgi:tRNA-binding protein
VYFSSLAVFFFVSIFNSMQVTWDEFEKIDMRVGTIMEVSDFPKARNPSYQIKIDFGVLGLKKSAAQVTALYTKEQLLGKQVIAVVNFPPRQIANFFSECLVLGVYSNNAVVLLQPEQKVGNGEKIG